LDIQHSFGWRIVLIFRIDAFLRTDFLPLHFGENSMAVPKKITAADVRASTNPAIKVHPSVTWFGRPVSNAITHFFHNSGWTANGVTVARSYMAIAGVAVLALPSPLIWSLSAFIYIVCFILDCVDGDLARVQKDASYLGKFLDGIADNIYLLLGSFALGIGAWQQFDQPLFLVVGGTITIISITNQMLRSRLSFFREWMVSLTGDLTEAEMAKAQKPRDIQGKLSVISFNGYFFAIFALLMSPVWGVLPFFTICILAQALPECIWIATTFAESNALLKRGRTSKHGFPDSSSSQ
jgi:phosphatidylglycerophosphate synthase